jgi:hypothetical protein
MRRGEFAGGLAEKWALFLEVRPVAVNGTKTASSREIVRGTREREEKAELGMAT